MLVLEALEGAVKVETLLNDALHQGPAREALREFIATAGRGLGPFQQAVVEGLPRVTPETLLEELEEDREGLEGVAPAVAQAVGRQLRRLGSEAGRLPPEAEGLGHASFRHSHFLLRGGQPVLLDLDGLCLCGVSADAGNFLAYLDRAGLRRPPWRPLLQECEGVFGEALRGPRGASPGWLAWYRAAAQVKWALRSAFSPSPRSPETTEGLLRLAEQTVEDGC